MPRGRRGQRRHRAHTPALVLTGTAHKPSPSSSSSRPVTAWCCSRPRSLGGPAPGTPRPVRSPVAARSLTSLRGCLKSRPWMAPVRYTGGMIATPYPPDLTDAAWDLSKDLIPPPTPGGAIAHAICGQWSMPSCLSSTGASYGGCSPMSIPRGRVSTGMSANGVTVATGNASTTRCAPTYASQQLTGGTGRRARVRHSSAAGSRAGGRPRTACAGPVRPAHAFLAVPPSLSLPGDGGFLQCLRPLPQQNAGAQAALLVRAALAPTMASRPRLSPAHGRDPDRAVARRWSPALHSHLYGRPTAGCTGPGLHRGPLMLQRTPQAGFSWPQSQSIFGMAPPTGPHGARLATRGLRRGEMHVRGPGEPRPPDWPRPRHGAPARPPGTRWRSPCRETGGDQAGQHAGDVSTVRRLVEQGVLALADEQLQRPLDQIVVEGGARDR